LDPERGVKVLHAASSIPQLVKELNEYQPDRIMVYSSLLEQLALQAIKGDLRIDLNWIMVGGEPLEESARQASLKAWGVNAHVAYASTEVAGISYDAPDFKGMCLVEDMMILEMVDEQHRPVTNSTKADRILVTRFAGGSFPLLRYETTDTVIMKDGLPGPNEPAPGVRRLESIEGRVDIMFEYEDGIKIHPIVFRSNLLKFDEVIEYQVQQTLNGAHVLVLVSKQVDLERVQSKLQDALTVAGLEKAIVTVQVVDTLPRHPQTHKLRRFIPLGNG
jgi:phenylacetate-coenzyme A ligase PaaK-like adenylate-forming protein